MNQIKIGLIANTEASVVDIDDRATWPACVTEMVTHWAEECEGSTTYTLDLPLPPESEDELRKHLTGRMLRAYHCTRLLPHEVHMVRKNGLQLLTADLILDRIKVAQEVGAISGRDAESLRGAHVFATGQHQGRENQVCLTLSRGIFQEDPGACRPLLSIWGGEGIYMSSRSDIQNKRLRILGVPTVVVALIDIGLSMMFPAVHKVFVGAVLGLPRNSADVFYRATIPPHHIEQILQPGDEAYRALGSLPMN